jgi:putative ABC transport system permease protein
MFNNYSKIAFRSLGRQKTFSIINAICLSTGMSVGLLALSAFIDMKEVDDFHVNSNRIYRVISKVDDGSDKLTFASSSSPLAQQLIHDGTGIESVVQFNRDFQPEFVKGGNTAIPL